MARGETISLTASWGVNVRNMSVAPALFFCADGEEVRVEGQASRKRAFEHNWS